MKTLFTLSFLCLSLLVSGQNLNAGIQLFENKDYQQASKTLTAIATTHTDYAEARYYLGRIAYAQREYETAWDYFKEATESNSSSSEYYTWEGHAISGLIDTVGKLRQAGLAPKIKNAYKKAVALDDTNLDALWGLVGFYSEAPGFVGGSMEKAEEAARAIGKVDALQGQNALAQVYMADDEPEKAEKAYLAAAELDQRRLANLGIFYQNQGWYDKAFDTFQKAFSLMPEDMNLLYQVGRTSALSGARAELGIASLERYLKETNPENARPSHAGAQMRLAMIYEKQGDKQKAKTLYQAALKKDPDMTLAQKGLERVK